MLQKPPKSKIDEHILSKKIELHNLYINGNEKAKPKEID